MQKLLLFVSLITLSGNGGVAQDTFTIPTEQLADGQTWIEDNASSFRTQLSGAEGEDSEVTESSVPCLVTIKYLDVGAATDKHARKLQVTYDEKAKVESEEGEGGTAPHPLAGKTITFTVSAEGKVTHDSPDPLTEEQTEELADHADKTEPILPSRAVKVGETWEIPPQQVGEIFASTGMIPEKGEGTLEAIEKRPEGTLARVKARLTGTISPGEESEVAMTGTMSMDVRCWADLETGESFTLLEMRMEASGNVTAEVDGQSIDVPIHQQVVGTSRVRSLRTDGAWMKAEWPDRNPVAEPAAK